MDACESWTQSSWLAAFVQQFSRRPLLELRNEELVQANTSKALRESSRSLFMHISISFVG
jgi:hypothetical protein